MQTFKGNIWVPPAHYDRLVAQAREAVRDYDSNLDFGKNELTNQWCIFLKRGATEATQEFDLPILGFNDIPSREVIQRRLYESDAVRNGNEIMDSLQRNNDDIEARREVAAQEASAQAAEGFDWGFRQMGKAPHTKVFIPGK